MRALSELTTFEKAEKNTRINRGVNNNLNLILQSFSPLFYGARL